MNAISLRAASSESGLPAQRIRELFDAGELFGISLHGELCLSRSALPWLRELARREAAPAGHTRPILRFQIVTRPRVTA
jgi:hypothetical protein